MKTNTSKLLSPIVAMGLIMNIAGSSNVMATPVDLTLPNDSKVTLGERSQYPLETLRNTTSVNQPNVIVILADDMGYGDLSLTGSPWHSTPNIDRIAEEGMFFDNFYVCPVCTPTRAMLMTGCYPVRVGLPNVISQNVSSGLNPNEYILPELFKDEGYRTGMVGKWHLGDQPEHLPFNQGFDFYYGLPYSNDMYKDDNNIPLWVNEEIGVLDPDQRELTDNYTRASINFMKKSVKDGEHFFLYFAHYYTHVPIHANERFMYDSQNGSYGAAMAAIDYSVGEILDTLDELGITDNTIIMFFSDNGTNNTFSSSGSNAPFQGWKGSLLEGGIRSPLLVRWPDVIKPGQVNHSVRAAKDILPTFASILGANALNNLSIKKAGAIDGEDFAGDLLGINDTHSGVYYIYNTAVGANAWGIRKGDYKYLRMPPMQGGGEYLYDLANDVHEDINLLDSPALATVQNELSDMLDAQRAYTTDSLRSTLDVGAENVINSQARFALSPLDPNTNTIYAEYDLDLPSRKAAMDSIFTISDLPNPVGRLVLTDVYKEDSDLDKIEAAGDVIIDERGLKASYSFASGERTQAMRRFDEPLTGVISFDFTFQLSEETLRKQFIIIGEKNGQEVPAASLDFYRPEGSVAISLTNVNGVQMVGRPPEGTFEMGPSHSRPDTLSNTTSFSYIVPYSPDLRAHTGHPYAPYEYDPWYTFRIALDPEDDKVYYYHGDELVGVQTLWTEGVESITGYEILMPELTPGTENEDYFTMWLDSVAVYQSPYTQILKPGVIKKSVPVFTDKNSKVLSTLSSDFINVAMPYTNTNASPVSLTMIVAVYDPSGRLVHSAVTPLTVDPPLTGTFGLSLDMPENADGSYALKGYRASVFLWDSVTFAPILPKYDF